MPSLGLHHITAISGPAPRNLGFYGNTLGLRLVKKTVNFDDPGTYHLYYGDERGQPGTIITFFPWAHAVPGRLGSGETAQASFRIPRAAIGFWTQRFVAAGIAHGLPERRFGETVLPFTDPDGLSLALVGVEGIETEPAWAGGDILADHAIRGVHGITLLSRDAIATGAILRTIFGYAEIGREGDRTRFQVDGMPMGGIVDLETSPAGAGRFGAGSVHHVAFRAASDTRQAAMVQALEDLHGIRTTEQRDRTYFRSVYFREPGGVLFEIATDDPGFAVDEPLASLGQALQLPPFLEPRRAELSRVLPALG